MHTARLSDRHPFHGAVDVVPHALNQTINAWGEDVSDTGMFVATAGAFTVGDQLALRFEVDGLDVHIRAAEVVWVRHDGDHGKPAGVGVRFVSVDPPARAALRRLQRRQQQQQAPQGTLSSLPSPKLTLPPLSRSIVEAAGASADISLDQGEDRLDATADLFADRLEETQDLLPPSRRAGPIDTSPALNTPGPSPSPSLLPISLAPLSQLPTISLPPEETGEQNLASESRVFAGVPAAPRPVTMLPQRRLNSLAPVSAPVIATTAPVPAPSLPPDVSLTTTPPTAPPNSADAPATPAHGVTQPLFILSSSPVIKAGAPSMAPSMSNATTHNATESVVEAAPADVDLFAGWQFRLATELPRAADDVADDAADDVADDAAADIHTATTFIATADDDGAVDEVASEANDVAAAHVAAPAATTPPETLRPTEAAPSNQTIINPTIIAAETIAPTMSDAGNDEGDDDSASYSLGLNATLAQDDSEAGFDATIIAPARNEDGNEEDDAIDAAQLDCDTAIASLLHTRIDDAEDSPEEAAAFTDARDEPTAFVRGPYTRRRDQRVPQPKRSSPVRAAAAVLLGGCAAGAIAGALLMGPTTTTTSPTSPTATATSPEAATATATATAPVIRSVADAEAELNAPPKPVAEEKVATKTEEKVEAKTEEEVTTKTEEKVAAKSEEKKATEEEKVAEKVAAKSEEKVAAKTEEKSEEKMEAKTEPTNASAVLAQAAGKLEVPLSKAGRVKKVFALQNPARVVVDFEEATLPASPMQVEDNGVLQVRFGSPSPGVQRVVVALAGEDKPDAVEGRLEGDRLLVSWRW